MSEINQKSDDVIHNLEVLLNKYSQPKTWLRTKDVTEYLGISTSQVHVLKNEGLLPYAKLHGSLYFKKSDIDKLLEERMSTQ